MEEDKNKTEKTEEENREEFTKKADNRISYNKVLISKLDNEIDSSKSKMKTLNDMEEGFVSLSKNIEKCVELLSLSMKGNNIESKLGDISESNQLYLKRVVSTIDDEKTTTSDRIKNLYEQKDNYEKEQKKLYREIEMNDHLYDDSIEKVEVERNKEVEKIEK